MEEKEDFNHDLKLIKERVGDEKVRAYALVAIREDGVTTDGLIAGSVIDKIKIMQMISDSLKP